MNSFPRFRLSTLCCGIYFDDMFCISFFCDTRMCMICTVDMLLRWSCLTLECPLLERRCCFCAYFWDDHSNNLWAFWAFPDVYPQVRAPRTTLTTLGHYTLPRCIAVDTCNWLCRLPWQSSVPRQGGGYGVALDLHMCIYIYISTIYV